jgi:hypothetical protein
VRNIVTAKIFKRLAHQGVHVHEIVPEHLMLLGLCDSGRNRQTAPFSPLDQPWGRGLTSQ